MCSWLFFCSLGKGTVYYVWGEYSKIRECDRKAHRNRNLDNNSTGVKNQTKRTMKKHKRKIFLCFCTMSDFKSTENDTSHLLSTYSAEILTKMSVQNRRKTPKQTNRLSKYYVCKMDAKKMKK